MAKEPLLCPVLCVSWQFAGACPSLKPTVKSSDWRSVIWQENAKSSEGNQFLVAISQFPHNKSWGSFSLQSIFSSVMNTSPSVSLLRKATLAFFPNRPLIYLGQMSLWATKCFVCTGSFLEVSLACNPLKSCYP